MATRDYSIPVTYEQNDRRNCGLRIDGPTGVFPVPLQIDTSLFRQKGCEISARCTCFRKYFFFDVPDGPSYR